MKTNYKHTRWLRTAALRVITIMAFLTALPGFAKAEGAGPLDVSKDGFAGKEIILEYASSGWTYKITTAGTETSFNGTITGESKDNEINFSIDPAVEGGILTIDGANIKSTSKNYNLFTISTGATNPLKIVLIGATLESTQRTGISTSTATGPMSIEARGDKESVIYGGIGLSKNNLTIDGGTGGGLNIQAGYATVFAAVKDNNPTVVLTGKITMTSQKYGVDISKACALTIGKDVHFASKDKALNIAEGITVTHNSPILQLTYASAPADDGTLVIKEGSEEVATFKTDGKLVNFVTGAIDGKSYTVWYTDKNGTTVKQSNADGSSKFTVKGNGIQSFTGMKEAPASTIKWAYDATAKTITNETAGITLSVTSQGNNELLIEGATPFKGTELDLSETIGGADDAEYTITKIAADAFKDKGLTKLTLPGTLTSIGKDAFAGNPIKEIHMNSNPFTSVSGGYSFSKETLENGLLYVPKGERAAYAGKDFRYILEEGETPYGMIFTIDKNLEAKDYAPLYGIGGQPFSFTLQVKKGVEGYGLPNAIKAYKIDAVGNETEATPITDYTYDKATGVVAISTVADKWRFEAKALGDLKPSESAGILVKNGDTYSENNGADAQFNGVINGKDYPISVILLGEGVAEAVMDITLKDVNAGETTVNKNTTVTATLEGVISIEKLTVENTGTLTILPNTKKATIGSMGSIKNNGTFTDKSGLYKVVLNSDAPLKLLTDESSSANVTVQTGGKVTLIAKGDPNPESSTFINPTVSYQWQEWKGEKEGWKDVKESTATKVSGTYGQSDTLAVSADDAGEYRCLIASTNGSVKTTLTHYITVKVKDTPITKWTYDADAKTITNDSASITLNVTLTGDNKLSLNSNQSFTGKVLDLSETIGGGDSSTYTILSIAMDAFKNKGITKLTLPSTLTTIGENAFAKDTITEVHMKSAIAIVATSFNFSKETLVEGLLYVPKGTRAAYADKTDFRYILEEGEAPYAMTFTLGDSLEVKDYAPIYGIGGQPFSFSLQVKKGVEGYGLPNAIKAYTIDADGKGTEATPGTDYTYDKATGVVTVTTIAGKWKFTADVLGDLRPGDNDKSQITVKDSGTYSDNGGTDTEFNGVINGKDRVIQTLTLGQSGTEIAMDITLKNISTGSTTVSDKATVNATLDGVIGFGDLIVNGNLTILPNTKKATLGDNKMGITNNGIFTDESGLIGYVGFGNAPLQIVKNESSLSNVIVETGGKVTLKAKGNLNPSNSGTAVVSYQWQVLNGETKVWGNVVESILTKASEAYGQSETLEVNADAAGEYRCLIASTAGLVKTTLSHYTTVTVKNIPPYVPTYYSVTIMPVEGATTTPSAGTSVVEEGYDFSFTLTLEKGYEQSVPVVTANGMVLTPRESDGMYVINSVTVDTQIKIDGIVRNTPTDNAGIGNGTIRIRGTVGTLLISTPQSASLEVYTISGNRFRQLNISAGDSRVQLPAGLYIIRIGDYRQKVFIR